MTIKCPLCDKDRYTATKQLDLHMLHYHILVKKIHEKIEEYKGKDCRDDPSVSVEHLLKSLLENQK